jgi:hypothetical protein
MLHYGFKIVRTLIVDIDSDEHVKAMNEINAAARMRLMRAGILGEYT